MLKNALEHPKSTFQGVLALVAAVLLVVVTGLTEGFSGGDKMAELGGTLVLLLGAIQRIFLSKDKPKG